MAEYPQKPAFKVQMRHIHFGSQLTHLDVSTKTNHPLNRTLVEFHIHSLWLFRLKSSRSSVRQDKSKTPGRWGAIRYGLFPDPDGSPHTISMQSP
jgi:hypothetical protein